MRLTADRSDEQLNDLAVLFAQMVVAGGIGSSITK